MRAGRSRRIRVPARSAVRGGNVGSVRFCGERLGVGPVDADVHRQRVLRGVAVGGPAGDADCAAVGRLPERSRARSGLILGPGSGSGSGSGPGSRSQIGGGSGRRSRALPNGRCLEPSASRPVDQHPQQGPHADATDAAIEDACSMVRWKTARRRGLAGSAHCAAEGCGCIHVDSLLRKRYSCEVEERRPPPRNTSVTLRRREVEERPKTHALVGAAGVARHLRNCGQW